MVDFTLDDVAYLRSDDGRRALADVADLALSGAGQVTDIATVRTRFGERTAILVETILLRRKAAAKFDDPSAWLFTDDALQQATAAAVAEHRARRLVGARVHDVTCSVGAELAALGPVAGQLLGSDLDPVRLAMAHNNIPDVPLCRADALRPVTRDTVVLADPGRRSGGRRRFDPRAYAPPLDALFDVYRGRDLVVKCAPGIDFDQLPELGFDGEVELCSSGGSVREACLWSAGLATPGVRRRASLLDRAEQLTDADPDECAVRPAGRWIIDPDGAVVRAGLVRQYGTRYGCWQLDPDIAYLSGDELPDGVRGFEVLAEIGFDEKRLRRELAARDGGALEILVRGVDVDPDALRRRLKLRGAQPHSVVITRIGTGAAGRAVAFICRPSR
ncbi:SAM-dependent methyltransferase [Mycobacterium adipatum]|uniref:SAM-dependent methyltransferase n=1 Tax=Mycobacterium adipatum TaxID=1682113 RepID=A0A172UQH1_9MYCO|nr:SAM-dependent methyltransferase [Mycobacterium adipatum]ANE81382.1 SAM-dependent methyltransferase [Mycobacterium adipatum]